MFPPVETGSGESDFVMPRFAAETNWTASLASLLDVSGSNVELDTVLTSLTDMPCEALKLARGKSFACVWSAHGRRPPRETKPSGLSSRWSVAWKGLCEAVRRMVATVRNRGFAILVGMRF